MCGAWVLVPRRRGRERVQTRTAQTAQTAQTEAPRFFGEFTLPPWLKRGGKNKEQGLTPGTPGTRHGTRLIRPRATGHPATRQIPTMFQPCDHDAPTLTQAAQLPTAWRLAASPVAPCPVLRCVS